MNVFLNDVKSDDFLYMRILDLNCILSMRPYHCVMKACRVSMLTKIFSMLVAYRLKSG